jgi:hypothetical protein
MDLWLSFLALTAVLGTAAADPRVKGERRPTGLLAVPRWLLVVLLILAILAVAVGLRYVVVRFGLLPVSEEAVLRKAVKVTVYYRVGAETKRLDLTGPELHELFAALDVRREDPYRSTGGPYGASATTAAPTVEFHFPNGMARIYALTTRTELGPLTVGPAFQEKLLALAARHEGRPIESLSAAPTVVGGNPNGQWNNGGNQKAPPPRQPPKNRRGAN